MPDRTDPAARLARAIAETRAAIGDRLTIHALYMQAAAIRRQADERQMQADGDPGDDP
jgi:hypothetical protein